MHSRLSKQAMDLPRTGRVVMAVDGADVDVDAAVAVAIATADSRTIPAANHSLAPTSPALVKPPTKSASFMRR